MEFLDSKRVLSILTSPSCRQAFWAGALADPRSHGGLEMRSPLVVERCLSFFSDPLTGSWFPFVLGLGHRVSSHFLSLLLVKVPITPELKHRFPSLCSLQRHRTGTQMKPCLPGHLFQAVSGFSPTMNGCPATQTSLTFQFLCPTGPIDLLWD